MKAKVVLVAIGCLAAGIAFAGGGHHQGRGHDIEKLAVLLDLDAHQKTEVEKILQAQHEQMRAAHQAAAASGERPSREQRRERHQQLRQDTLGKLGAVLNEQQLKKFEILTERHARHGRRPDSP